MIDREDTEITIFLTHSY